MLKNEGICSSDIQHLAPQLCDAKVGDSIELFPASCRDAAVNTSTSFDDLGMMLRGSSSRTTKILQSATVVASPKSPQSTATSLVTPDMQELAIPSVAQVGVGKAYGENADEHSSSAPHACDLPLRESATG